MFYLGGDNNLRHSTGSFGILSWPEILILFSGLLLWVIKRKWNAVAVFLVLGLLAGVSPAALTWEGVPHALRSIGAWPFYALLAGFIYSKLNTKIIYVIVPLSVIFVSCFYFYYFTQYAKISYIWFDGSIKQAALSSQAKKDFSLFKAATSQYADAAARYYVMTYDHKSCLESKGFRRSTSF